MSLSIKQVKKSRQRESSRRLLKIKRLIRNWLNEGFNESQVATKLNNNGFRQYNGKGWNAGVVKRYAKWC